MEIKKVSDLYKCKTGPIGYLFDKVNALEKNDTTAFYTKAEVDALLAKKQDKA